MDETTIEVFQQINKRRKYMYCLLIFYTCGYYILIFIKQTIFIIYVDRYINGNGGAEC